MMKNWWQRRRRRGRDRVKWHCGKVWIKNLDANLNRSYTGIESQRHKLCLEGVHNLRSVSESNYK